MQGADQLLNDFEISPASSNLFVSSSVKFWYFSRKVYCLTNTGLPSVTCTSKVCRLVHPTSVEDFDMILANFDSNMFITLDFHLSASLASSRFTSGLFIMVSISMLLSVGYSGSNSGDSFSSFEALCKAHL